MDQPPYSIPLVLLQAQARITSTATTCCGSSANDRLYISGAACVPTCPLYSIAARSRRGHS
eukprot:9740642-Alexandrium_andersonii.AAC.1